MNEPNDVADGSIASNCSTALIVYQPPSWFTAVEQAIWDHGTHAERSDVLTKVCMRGLGIPSQLVESGETNYSSAKMDLRAWDDKAKRAISLFT